MANETCCQTFPKDEDVIYGLPVVSRDANPKILGKN